MKSDEIRQKFLNFFEARGHKILPEAPLVPENDPTVLFNTAGMQQLVPYLTGQKHPLGNRLVNIQKCVRTVDIDDVGDNTHATFFEMMGNWSLGDYFKKDAINFSYELLTSKEEGFGLDPRRIYVTCFEGDENAPRDEESAGVWKEIFEKNGISGNRIFFLGVDDNWWKPGDNGPCGPDTEMFYDLTGELSNGMSQDEFVTNCASQKLVEIWNDVFMEYEMRDGKVVGKLSQQNVDTGSGLERVAAVLQGKNNIFETDIYEPIISFIRSHSNNADEKSLRIIADHIKASAKIMSEGIRPSNTDQGYILRRLLRRAIRYADKISFDTQLFADIVKMVLNEKADEVISAINDECKKFEITLKNGSREFEKMVEKGITAKDAFLLFSSYGFPFELSQELALEKGVKIDENEFKREFEAHQQESRKGSDAKFKGGLGDTSEQSTKYHTATHLLHQALRDVIGNEVQQKGSNINQERMRFDFACPQKLTDEQIKKVEEIVNEKISENLPVQKIELDRAEAEKTGALHFFADKYGDKVSVYFIGNDLDSAYSKEFCGGPHVENTGTLGKFKIIKEEAVSAGVRRIKAILE